MTWLARGLRNKRMMQVSECQTARGERIHRALHAVPSRNRHIASRAPSDCSWKIVQGQVGGAGSRRKWCTKAHSGAGSTEYKTLAATDTWPSKACLELKTSVRPALFRLSTLIKISSGQWTIYVSCSRIQSTMRGLHGLNQVLRQDVFNLYWLPYVLPAFARAVTFSPRFRHLTSCLRM